jgi:hypothetical protein
MDQRIMEPNGQFPMDKLSLTTPIFINSGNYFIKYTMNDAPLYIQPPKCITKQGFIKGGKHIYCDLLFTNENEEFIKWLEDLESYSQRYIYDHRSQWFESDLELHDIENFFTSPMKIYKSGKYYIVRTSVPTRLGKCTLKIFDEEEMDVPMEEIKDGTQVLTIWQVLGIKCSTRVFQIDFEIKQMMVVRPDNLFDRCILGKTKPRLTGAVPEDPSSLEKPASDTPTPVIAEPLEPVSENVPPLEPNGPTAEELSSLPEPTDQEPPQTENPEDPEEEASDVLDNEPVGEEFLWLDDPTGDSAPPTHLERVDLKLQENAPTQEMSLKPRNDVYYTIYTEAKQKAEEARNLAISAYLEAKRIKELYMIEEPLEVFPDMA